jgi:DNA-binding response OmpR family regulator
MLQSTHTLLLVDDSPLTLEVHRRALENAGYAVRVARDLDEIERAKASGPLAMVLLDVEMAEAFGDDIAMIMRGQDDSIPIYLVSALPEDELSVRAEDAGVDGYLSKRAGVDALVKLVTEALGDDGASPRDHRSEFLPLLVASAKRRVDRARGISASGEPDAARQIAYELHALIGEAAVLGQLELADAAAAGDLDAIERCAAAVATSVPAGAPAPSAPLVRSGSGQHILLVDDSELYRATMRAILEDAGYVVTEVGSCDECRALLPTSACDLALLDVNLGDGDGIALIHDVRTHRPNAAVVVMTGGDNRTVPEGADLVLLKTLDPTSVMVKLEHLLGRAPA